MRPHLYKRPCPSVRPLVGPLVGWSVGNAFVKIDEKWAFTDSKWSRHCWTRGTRRKEGQGGKREEEEEEEEEKEMEAEEKEV